MRLLHTSTLIFEEFDGIATEPYAILSHCWNTYRLGYEEVTYQQILDGRDLSNCSGWQKVSRCCRIARSRSLDWIWCDTACIDKTNSSELSETINSMFEYYARAAECYVFLDDVLINDERDENGRRSSAYVHPVYNLGKSRWFSRGWTLQELLAPSSVIFYDSVGEYIGTRTELATTISIATGIQPRYLVQRTHIREACIAQRMSWASRRATTRPEDLAYSLLGIFDVNMPLLYGEGAAKAFQRLQLAIIAQSNDESIFAWGVHNPTVRPTGMLAISPAEFLNSGNVERLRNPKAKTSPPFHGTARGISFRYTPHITETILAPPYKHVNMVKRIRLACQVVEGSSKTTIDINVKFHGGRFCRIGLESNERSRLVDVFRDLIGGERTLYVASTLDEIDPSPHCRIEREPTMWQIAADLPPHELLQWPARWVLSNALLIYWFFFRFNDYELNLVVFFLLLMLVNDIRLSGLSAALLIMVTLPALTLRWAQAMREGG